MPFQMFQVPGTLATVTPWCEEFGEPALAHKLREPLAQELRHRDAVATWLKRHAALVVGGTLKYSA